MVTDSIYRLAVQIEMSGAIEFSALELRQFMHSAKIGLALQTIRRHTEEAFFDGLIVATYWKPGKGRSNVDKTNVLNVSRWRRGPSFDEIINNGGEAHVGPAHA